MFITRSKHLAEMQHLHVRIADLESLAAYKEQAAKATNLIYEAQIQDLRKLVFPATSTYTLTKEAREVDAVLSASEKPPELSEKELNLMLEGAREFDLLLSGNYDTDLVN